MRDTGKGIEVWYLSSDLFTASRITLIRSTDVVGGAQQDCYAGPERDQKLDTGEHNEWKRSGECPEKLVWTRISKRYEILCSDETDRENRNSTSRSAYRRHGCLELCRSFVLYDRLLPESEGAKLKEEEVKDFRYVMRIIHISVNPSC